MELHDVIRIRRSELGLTLEQIAQACGVGRSIVAKWERGEVTNLKRDNLKSLADVLQVSPLVLLDREDLPASPSISDSEYQMLEKFRALDARGKSAVLNVLEHEYQAIAGEGPTSALPRNA